jgi:hypothetical protein
MGVSAPKPSLPGAAEHLRRLVQEPSALDARTGGRIIAGSLALGVLGDALFYHSALGLNLPLWTATLAVVYFASCRGRPGAPDVRQLALLGLALLFASMMAWRGSQTLQALNLMATFGCLALAVVLPAGAHLRRTSILELTLLATGAAVAFAASLPRVAIDGSWSRRAGIRSRGNTLMVSRVLLLSVPLLAGFGGLFVAADAVFQSRVEDLLNLDMLRAWEHAFWFVGAGWFTCGFLWLGLAVKVPAGVEAELPEGGRLKAIETGVVLGSLAALFAAFVLVQVRYLFGGESLVQQTIGLTYAEYARRGFFELVAASLLLLPVLLAFDWARRRDSRSSTVYRLLAGALVLLLFVVMLSAMQRMRVYMDAFGLTESRLYVVTILIWLVVVFLWFLWTVLCERRNEFVVGACAAAAVALVALNIVSPDSLIARTNTSRLSGGRSFDAYHASQLGPEAAPILVQRIKRLAPDDACVVAEALLANWSGGSGDIRSWNLARERARDAVDDHRAELLDACED